jgi:hypothetical protein
MPGRPTLRRPRPLLEVHRPSLLRQPRSPTTPVARSATRRSTPGRPRSSATRRSPTTCPPALRGGRGGPQPARSVRTPRPSIAARTWRSSTPLPARSARTTRRSSTRPLCEDVAALHRRPHVEELHPAARSWPSAAGPPGHLGASRRSSSAELAGGACWGFDCFPKSLCRVFFAKF